jgi:hypothetical protein
MFIRKNSMLMRKKKNGQRAEQLSRLSRPSEKTTKKVYLSKTIKHRNSEDR